MIYPEGGRSPDGWGQDFKGGAAYLSARTGAPVVPVFIDGTGSIFGKGMKRPKPGRTPGRVRRPAARRSTARPPAASTPASRPPSLTLADEAPTDCWTARQRAAAGTSPASAAPTTPAGAGSGTSATTAARASPAGAAARSAAGPTSAEPTIWPFPSTVVRRPDPGRIEECRDRHPAAVVVVVAALAQSAGGGA